MTEQIVITGVGCVTPLGTTLAATWQSLLDGQFVTDRGVVPIEQNDGPRVEQLALLAAREAIGDSDVTDAALFVGTSKGPADQWLSDGHIGLYGLDTLAATLARALGVRGNRSTYSAACASGLHAMAIAVLRMRHERLRRAVVIASESSLHGIWSQTFKRLGVLARPGEPCRPFDLDRHGFVISEAAAAVVLERRVPRPGELIVTDARFGGDAHHLTGSDPEAGLLRHLISTVAGDRPVDFVHAHATATGNDEIELAAIEAAIGRHAPLVYSHKGAIGHTLGASGLVAAAISTRVHATGLLPPHATTRDAIVTANARLAGPTATTIRPAQTSLCLASGFGGATAVVGLRQFESGDLASGNASAILVDPTGTSGV